MPDERPRRPGRPAPEEDWADKTQLEAPRAPQHKLVVSAGPNEGQEYPLEGGEATIGRAPENGVHIQDSSMSRRHARLRKQGDDWSVSDLKSGNGTSVNGLPLGGEIVLRSGDVITMGDTSLRYLAPPRPTVTSETQVNSASEEDSLSKRTRMERGRTGERPARPEAPNDEPTDHSGPPAGIGPATTLPEGVPAVAFDEEVPKTQNLQPPSRPAESPARASGPKPTLSIPMQPGASGGKRRMSQMPSRTKAKREAEQKKRQRTMLLWGGVALGVCLLPVGIRAGLAWSAHRAQEKVDAERAKLEAEFQVGKDAMRHGRFEEARAAFTHVNAVDPNYGAGDFLGRIDGEVEIQKHLRAADEALDHGQLGKAGDLLARIRPDTAQRDELVRAKTHLAQRARERLQQAQRALDAGDADESIGITTDVLKALPDERDAMRIRDAALGLRSTQGQ